MPKGKPRRTKKFTVLMNSEEQKMLQELAEENGGSAAGLLRSYIRALHKQRIAVKKQDHNG